MLNKSLRQWLLESERPREENTTALATAIFRHCGLKIGDNTNPELKSSSPVEINQIKYYSLMILLGLTKGRGPELQEQISEWIQALTVDDADIMKELILDALKEGNLNKLRQIGA
jgi:hypothetical protein